MAKKTILTCDNYKEEGGKDLVCVCYVRFKTNRFHLLLSCKFACNIWPRCGAHYGININLGES